MAAPPKPPVSCREETVELNAALTSLPSPGLNHLTLQSWWATPLYPAACPTKGDAAGTSKGRIISRLSQPLGNGKYYQTGQH